MNSNLPATKSIDGAVRKANEAIAIRPVGGEALTFLTRKLYNTMLFHAQRQGSEERVFEMPLRTITRGSDFESHDIQLIKEHLRKMKRAEVEWNSPGKEWGISSLVAEARIKKVGGELILNWEYSSTIQAKLLSPMQYTPMALAYQAIMRTHAGLALLEICLRYETFSAGLTERKPWEWWYGVLTGNTDSNTVGSRLHFYRYFKRDTIKPAMQEVNSLTEFQVELEEHTQGRKVMELQFKISKRAQKSLDLDDQVVDVSLITRMMALGLKESDAQKIYASHEENRVRSALDVTEKKMRSRSKPESAAAYFRSALNADWLKIEPETKALPATKAKPEPTADPELIVRRQAALEAFDAMAEEGRAVVLKEFAEANPALAASIRKNPAGKTVRNALVGWLLKR